MDNAESIPEHLMATTMKSFRNNKIDTQSSPKSLKKTISVVKRSQPLTFKFLESNCKKDASKVDLQKSSSSNNCKASSTKIRLLSRSNFDSDYQMIRDWRKSASKAKVTNRVNPTLDQLEDVPPASIVTFRDFNSKAKQSAQKLHSAHKSPRNSRPSKFVKNQPEFKIKELDYKMAIDKMKQVFRPGSSLEENSVANELISISSSANRRYPRKESISSKKIVLLLMTCSCKANFQSRKIRSF